VRAMRRIQVLAGACLCLAAICGCASATSSSPAATAADPAVPRQADSLPGTEVTQPGDGDGDLRQVTFYSTAIGRADSYLIYLPPGYQSLASTGTRLPVLYMLHGDGNHGSNSADHLFERGRVGPTASALFASGQLGPMLIVIPNLAGQNSDGDTEWANTSRGAYETALLQMVHSVDQTWPTIASRSGRGIAGLSMGGYGAVNVALHHLNRFSTVESWSGYFNQTRTGPYVGASKRLIRATSPAFYVHRLGGQLAANPIHVLLYVSPTEGFADEQAPFVKTLRSLRVPVTARVFRGDHDFDFWSSRMGLALTFGSRWLSGPGSP
jgi:S-formylglutathione hydrolase FrmB